MSNCTCGRTTRPPFCDGSHWLSEKDYAERCLRLYWLKSKTESAENKKDERSTTQMSNFGNKQ